MSQAQFSRQRGDTGMSPHALRATALAASAVAGCLLLPGAAWAGTARVVTSDESVRGEPVTQEVVSRLVFKARPVSPTAFG